MPRVANQSRAQRIQATPAKQSPIKIPLNDDRQEKALRLQSRQALHDLQLNQIKAAASPMRRVTSGNEAGNMGPNTPPNQNGRMRNGDEMGGLSLAATAMTPMKRMPILANFEEWMKMATDNKINATNSWNFALIDYFHDMSLLKEGDGVNFQKASCTLDGCVKIYTSRVDSVATETGKLLSGLADSGNKKQKKGGAEEAADGEDGEEGDEDDEEGGAKKKKAAKRGRSSENTLAPSFAPLQLKKFELEFAVDPLFKKASADFDEGGAKGLLLNHLSIDAQGRIVFDSSDDADASKEEPTQEASKPEEAAEGEETSSVRDTESQETEDIDLSALASKFFPNLDLLEEQDICPSLKDFDLGAGSKLSDIPFLKAPPEEDEDQSSNNPSQQPHNLADKSGIFLDDDNMASFDDDDALGGFDMVETAGFGEGGEVWAKCAALEERVVPVETGMADLGTTEEGAAKADVVSFDAAQAPTTHGISLFFQDPAYGGHEGILKYFDNALQKNWAGPEHWRIKRIKDSSRGSTSLPAPSSRKKEKEAFEIDFASPLDPALAELIYTPASSASAISLPKAQRVSKTRNLLPDDKHFNSRQLVRLFLKPRARIGAFHPGSKKRPLNPVTSTEPREREEVDQAFWAQQAHHAPDAPDDQQEPKGNYDADFFQDDGLPFADGVVGADDDDDGLPFADAREVLSPEMDGAAMPGLEGGEGGALLPSGDGPGSAGAFGTQLITQNRRVRPEYVQYARVAKKVDVRRLKEEIWRGIGFDEEAPPQNLATPPREENVTDGIVKNSTQEPLKFTQVINGLQAAYQKQAMAEISTSFCFICLLHLANEKGLAIENVEGFEELGIRRDWTAEV